MKNLTGWGLYPHSQSHIRLMDAEKSVPFDPSEKVIARGLGRSYGDTAQNDGGTILHMTPTQNEQLTEEHIVRVGGSVSLDSLLHTLVPLGRFLPVTPGTKWVTVGGAIANDVHGKNHAIEGSIASHIRSFLLKTASGDIVMCSREKNSDLFWATVGGIGLTGVITESEWLTVPIETSYLQVETLRTKNIADCLQMFQENDVRYPYQVAWIDGLSQGEFFGRCVLQKGRHITQSEWDKEKKGKQALPLHTKPRLSAPFHPPGFVLNRYTMKTYNEWYYRSHSDGLSVVHYDDFFYPLDSIRHWNRMYGKRGFLQYQMVFPTERAEEGMTRTLNILHQRLSPSFLGVLKRYGKESGGYLSFPMEGYGLALDLPIKGNETFVVCDELDNLVTSLGGRCYLAKDARMSQKTFEKMYGHKLCHWRNVKKEFDPHAVFSSSMSRRLGLT